MKTDQALAKRLRQLVHFSRAREPIEDGEATAELLTVERRLTHSPLKELDNQGPFLRHEDDDEEYGESSQEDDMDLPMGGPLGMGLAHSSCKVLNSRESFHRHEDDDEEYEHVLQGHSGIAEGSGSSHTNMTLRSAKPEHEDMMAEVTVGWPHCSPRVVGGQSSTSSGIGEDLLPHRGTLPQRGEGRSATPESHAQDDPNERTGRGPFAQCPAYSPQKPLASQGILSGYGQEEDEDEDEEGGPKDYNWSMVGPRTNSPTTSSVGFSKKNPPDPTRHILTVGGEKIIVSSHRYMFKRRTLLLRGAVEWWEDRLFAYLRPQAPIAPTTGGEKNSRNQRSCRPHKSGRPREKGIALTRMGKRGLIQYWVLPPFRGVPPVLCWE